MTPVFERLLEIVLDKLEECGGNFSRICGNSKIVNLEKEIDNSCRRLVYVNTRLIGTATKSKIKKDIVDHVCPKTR